MPKNVPLVFKNTYKYNELFIIYIPPEIIPFESTYKVIKFWLRLVVDLGDIQLHIKYLIWFIIFKGRYSIRVSLTYNKNKYGYGINNF